MKVCELKLRVDELKSNIVPLTSPRDIIDFASKLDEIVGPLEDERDVHPEMMPPVKELMNQFWHWVVCNLPYEQWKNGTHVASWLSLQQSLIKAGLLGADFHHPILYEVLENHFNQLAGKGLRITELMPLLIRASRMLGYANHNEADYPFVKLNAGIAAQKPQEIAKIKDIMFLLRSVFYLISRYCTLEQLTLMPFLIDFRYSTTDEERRSELAIFNWLTQNTAECLEFFNTHDQYIDTRSITLIESLQNVTDLIPTARGDFLRATNRSRWIYHFIQQARVCEGGTEDDLIESTLHLLDQDFSTQKDQSFASVLNFTAAVNKQARMLAGWEAKVVHSAIFLFCLEKYIKQRKEDARDKHSFLSLSGETKRQAAEKRKSVVLGKPVRFGFFETLAINQGRLKKLIDFLEGEQTPDAEDTSYIRN